MEIDEDIRQSQAELLAEFEKRKRVSVYCRDKVKKILNSLKNKLLSVHTEKHIQNMLKEILATN